MILLLRFVDTFFMVYFWMLFGRILMSWIPELRDSKAGMFLAYYTDPYLNVFRSIIPPLGMIDISPIFAFIALEFIKTIIKKLIIALM